MACTKILAGNLSCLKNLRLCFITRHSSTIQQELPPRKLFFKEPIQTRLYNLLLLDAKSISTEKLTQPSEVTYKLLEKDEIEDCMNKVCQVSLKKMQFPPVLDPFDNDDEYNIWSDTNDYYKTTNSNLSQKYGDKCDLFSTKYDFDTYDAFVDESHDREKQYTKDKIIKKDEIQGFSKFCHVFVDTSLDKQWLDRMIVIRETDGNLRESMNYERRRILNRILPQHYERRPYIPKMFTFNFKNMLDTKEYNYLLDNLLLQFECNDPIYVDIIERVYTSVNETFSFDLLHSTRHFGGLVNLKFLI
ncbi:hypothetical protein A3Q56_05036 [Intoshia linei]|uniref:28S ribosomal protein S22, mitochondrial n=1 Tax=Intoshia linei TaxID=1819745 RepID=A0A177B0S2_9BILA|nr:hypothetical protein A3Q56_05036 [Intoshia linei]